MNRKALQRIIRGVVRAVLLALGGLAIGTGLLGGIALANAYPVAAMCTGGVTLFALLVWVLGGES